MKQYLDALKHILDNGEDVHDRTGVGTRTVFGYQMRFDLQKGFPAVTTKRLAWRSVVGELLWFLEGSTDERRLAELTYNKPREELKDKNRFSFLLYENGQYRAYRYASLIFGFITSPFILNFILRHHAEKGQSSLLQNVISNKFYVDNLIYTTNSEQDAINLCQDISVEMREAGFEFHEWISNSSKIRSSFPQETVINEDFNKMLGYIYNSNSDSLHLKEVGFDPDVKTKREMVSNLYRLFDPLGLLSPLFVNGKFILRELNSSKVGWDEKVPDSIIKLWKNFCKEMNEHMNLFSVPRRIMSSELPVDVFVFVDASSQAYGFSSYVVQNGNSALLMSKVKLAPSSVRSLPSLELLSSYLALQCMSTIINDKNFHNKVNSIKLFTDSQVSLAWLLSGSAQRKNIFINNRLKDIKLIVDEFTKSEVSVTYNYVPTDHNVADLLTRPCKIQNFIKNKSLWFEGPQWIHLTESQYPKGNLGCIPSKFTNLIANVTVDQPPNIIIDVNNSSSYSHLIGVVTKVMLAKNKFLKKDCTLEQAKAQAFNYLVKNVQEKYYPNVIKYLKGDTNISVPVIVAQLNLFVDTDGVIRSRGRIQKSTFLSYDAKNPVLIHQKSHLTRLLIRYAHFNCKHLGTNSVLNYLRQGGMWIPKARSVINSIIKKCIICKKYNNRHFPLPPTAPLPIDKVNFVRPFNIVGVDYTAHIFVSDSTGVQSKMYILIFCCFQTRAIHLELLKSMSVEDFVLAFVRFTNRFGIPKTVYSDNAKSFIASASVLSNVFADNCFLNKFGALNITFKNIPTYSPWYGANWERLIKVVKSCLYKTIGKNKVDYFNLLTTLSDIQNVINSRPLTYRSRDNELDILTPNHFLSFGNNFPSIVFIRGGR